MKVRLLSHTPFPEKSVASAAKLCYSDSDVDSLIDGLTDEKIDSFVDMLASIGHESPIEHVSFTFAVEGISRACSHQLVRHRIASYSQQSQRYVDMDEFEYVTPPEILSDPESKLIYDSQMESAAHTYRDITKSLEKKYVQVYITQGIEESEARKKAKKKAIEDARFVLPNACTTKIIITMNARSLMNFFKHRCCNRAQWEIRELAMEMLRHCKAVAPTLFKNAGPSCLRGKCPEGKMSCGQASKIREYFK